ncbi:hypothetical protein [Candidatus Deferrimicrobium sp.]|uniref:hypothetical protein n=1 Tax=Candidatus Deferrimicrobium sp. TaxID=3060586 RepID=UPI00272527EC|nr:hypothetical protein [Candidatus Deferrimicrobium sp.]MDO8738867.1 hypothetical protein [Candidatus Deferrimicrobium sp.]
MRKGILWGIIGVMSLLVLGVSSEKAEAIPAFARKYKTTCVTCHAPFPRLTALGEAFRLNGYKLPAGDELYVKDQPLSMGVEAYKKVFPQAIWPSDIPGMPPVSLQLVNDLSLFTGGKEPNTKFELPLEMELFAAGSFGENMSFFTELEFEGAEFVFVGWLMWEDILKKSLGENRLNFRIGTVGMNEIGLPDARNGNRFTREKYLYMGKLALDEGPGLEANGFGKHWRYAVGVAEGDGATNEKDYYGTMAFKIGGLGFDGSGGTTAEGGLATAPSGYWRDDSILFGGFAFKGRDGASDKKNDRYGLDVRLNYKDLSLIGGFARGDNDGANEIQDHWFGEAIYFAYPWLQPFVRYETLSSNLANKDQARIIAGASILARANVKVTVEGRVYTKNDPAVAAAGGSKNDDDRILARLQFAF